MRSITLIVVHCTATVEGKNYTVADVDRWHKQRGWKMIGYHYLIYLDGSIHQGRPESMVGAHCVNHNQHSIGVCYVGGLDKDKNPKDTRTEAQRTSLFTLISQLHKKYPKALILGHNVLANKSCPCFDAVKEYANLQPK